mmetsp:Transcript_6595/g.17167  ORF Transcript_6595/g.17167 Transcript_6595/m.17167 type:complete len:98 (-) Transcript_6595:1047-1340(-)
MVPIDYQHAPSLLFSALSFIQTPNLALPGTSGPSCILGAHLPRKAHPRETRSNTPTRHGRGAPYPTSSSSTSSAVADTSFGMTYWRTSMRLAMTSGK